jgi:hypothetical protein
VSARFLIPRKLGAPRQPEAPSPALADLPAEVVQADLVGYTDASLAGRLRHYEREAVLERDRKLARVMAAMAASLTIPRNPEPEVPAGDTCPAGPIGGTPHPAPPAGVLPARDPDGGGAEKAAGAQPADL